MTEEELDKIANERMNYCPFCPVKPKLEERNLFKLEYILHCPQCGLTMKSHSLEDLIRQWNTRHYPDDSILIRKADMFSLKCSLHGLLNPVMGELKVTEGILEGVNKWLTEKYGAEEENGKEKEDRNTYV